MLDGWSSSIILKDVFTFYNALNTNRAPELDNIPSYKSYLNWLNKIDINDAKVFWKNSFQDYKKPFLFNKNQHKINTPIKNHIQLSNVIALNAQELAKTYQTTLNTLFQGLWAIIISKYSNNYDVVYGNTVSGRSGDFPNIELIAGMFANVIPVRTKLDFNSNIKDWLKNIQLQQLEARKFEHITVGEITEWVDNTENSLFDSLFIFENFPWNDIKSGDITVHSSKSGITTTYPITITIKTGDLISEASLFTNETNFWILNRFEEIINLLHQNKNISFNLLFENITPIDSKNLVKTNSTSENSNTIIVPKNKVEVQLLEIWQTLLNNDNISAEDNFFEIGGKSLLAVRLFSMIKNKIDIQLSPTTILEHPTIKSLATLINNESGIKIENWNNLVPIRSKGNKTPIFCLHAGGGHVFFLQFISQIYR